MMIVIRRNEPSSFLKYTNYLVKYVKRFLNVKVDTISRITYEMHEQPLIIHMPFLGRGGFPSLRLLMKLKSRGYRIVVTLHGFDSASLRLLFKERLLQCPYEYCSIKQVLADTKNKLLWYTFGRLIDANNNAF